MLTAELLRKRGGSDVASAPKSMLQLPTMTTGAGAQQQYMLTLLHQTRQDEIGGSLFQVLSELNSELQQCAGAGEKLSYAAFEVLRSRVSRRLRRWLTTKIFLMLRDESGACDIHALYDFFYSVGCMVKTRLTLQSYETNQSVGDKGSGGGVGSLHASEPKRGWLRERDVERWILDLYPSITNRSEYAHKDPEFLAVYTAAATRCFFFFLDPQRVDRVSIDTLVASPITDALLEVTLTAEEDALSEAEAREMCNNWFSPDCVRRVFEHYSELDTHDKGLVAKDNLRLFQGLTLDPPRALTATFLDRLFEEVPTHRRDGVAYLDFKGFLDLTLAFEFIQNPRSLRFLWRCVDVSKQGYLDKPTVAYFYRDIADGLRQEQLEAPDLSDVVDEIFDMAKPENKDRVTLTDLERSKTAHTVLSMLIDVNAFWLYENRSGYTIFFVRPCVIN